MNEVQAWNCLARLWAKAKRGNFNTKYYTFPRSYYVLINGVKCTGLCESISELSNLYDEVDGTDSGIDPDTYYEMKEEIPETPGLLESRSKWASVGFIWPTNKKGASERAAFCRKMARIAKLNQI